ncbi:inositol-3-phosphate synthase [Nonomuraea sp. NPDC051941]|uniref:inositol-3-phosphate synthase n=1 Tax=Nonomuraea sp. NPDC051941 TaxID=3364373 RepID=UPI0037C536E2
MSTGVWLIGARGSVATTTIVGAAALQAGLTDPVGLVTELPGFAGLGLPDVGELVFGGHDLGTVPLVKRAEELAGAGVLPGRLLEPVREPLERAESRIRPGYGGHGHAGGQAQAAAGLAADIALFRERNRLERVVVVNLASTEPPAVAHPAHASLAELRAALAGGPDVLPPSSVYAYAALGAGHPYVDFTPSPGGRLPALQELAEQAGAPYAGSDAKTGETLVRSALAPMFVQRALRVRSWSGSNLLGGGDGATLAAAGPASSKTGSKSRLLGETFGHPVDGVTHIDYVPGLGEWKTAWDHVAFEGFLGAGMTLQFTWQGCDSALAAPLVLDLARLMAAAGRAGRSGAIAELGFFFKDPVATDQHSLAEQYARLHAWAEGL